MNFEGPINAIIEIISALKKIINIQKSRECEDIINKLLAQFENISSKTDWRNPPAGTLQLLLGIILAVEKVASDICA